MTDLNQIYDWTQTHEKADKERFDRIHARFDALPGEIKKDVNGSVEVTVNRQIVGMFRWLGLGGFILLVTIGVAWGMVTTKGDRHDVQLQSTLDAKDLKNVELQLSNQAAVIGSIKDDVSFLKAKWVK